MMLALDTIGLNDWATAVQECVGDGCEGSPVHISCVFVMQLGMLWQVLCSFVYASTIILSTCHSVPIANNADFEARVRQRQQPGGKRTRF